MTRERTSSLGVSVLGMTRSNVEVERPRRSFAGALVGFRSPGAESAHPAQAVHGSLERLLEVHLTECNCARAALELQARRHSLPPSAPPALRTKSLRAWRAAPQARLLLHNPDLGRAPRPQSKLPPAARALASVERRRLQDYPVSLSSYVTVLSEGTPSSSQRQISLK